MKREFYYDLIVFGVHRERVWQAAAEDYLVETFQGAKMMSDYSQGRSRGAGPDMILPDDIRVWRDARRLQSVFPNWHRPRAPDASQCAMQ